MQKVQSAKSFLPVCVFFLAFNFYFSFAHIHAYVRICICLCFLQTNCSFLLLFIALKVFAFVCLLFPDFVSIFVCFLILFLIIF